MTRKSILKITRVGNYQKRSAHFSMKRKMSDTNSHVLSTLKNQGKPEPVQPGASPAQEITLHQLQAKQCLVFTVIAKMALR